MHDDGRHSPPHHRPGEVTTRPKGILKNPSFTGSYTQGSPEKEDIVNYPPSAPLDPQESKEVTIQNTIQNAGHRRSSSAARRSSAPRRHSSSANAALQEDDPEKQRLKWDEANLYLAEQESGGRMKITEPKTPYQYGDAMNEDEDDGDVAIDPRYVNVDEVDMANNKKRSHETEIPGLDIGEAEDVSATELDSDRIVTGGSLSRESTRDKHVSVSDGDEGYSEQVGMPTREEKEKHRLFEAQRRKHYEMSSVKGMLGHPEELDRIDDEDDGPDAQSTRGLPNRGPNGV